MPDNVLDKSAMATLARLESELPHISGALTDLAAGQKEMSRKVSEMCRHLAVLDNRATRNTTDIEAHDKELDGLSDRIGTIRDDVAGLKAADRIVGGANALYASLVAVLAAIFGGN